jgi:predicted ATPase/DNA-binding winged helix-turn-helix (wHTH) protein
MAPDFCRFGEYELDRSAFQLRCNGYPLKLERIPLELLFLLVERHGQIVTRSEILEHIWGKGVFVDVENSINSAIRKVRRALNDDPEAPRFVATIASKGYRFIAQVQGRASASTSLRPAQSQLVGRKSEINELRAALGDASSGHGRIVLVSGEAGVGKTRLSEEITTFADGIGFRQFTGHCSEDRDSVPYLPFVEMLEDFIDHTALPETLRAQLGVEGPELARLLPKIKHIVKDLPPVVDLPPAQGRRQLFNSFCDFAARLASAQPMLMILEDLHWADDSTLSLLGHLTQRLSTIPLLVIGTYRDADMHVTRGLAQTLEALSRRRLASWMRLKSLPLDAVGALLQGLSGQSLPSSLVNEIYAETEGNPFFVEELYRHLHDENRLYDSSGQFRSRIDIAEHEAPPSVRLVVARRVARLSDLTQSMLATAAIIGRSFNYELLQASCGMNSDSLLESVEQAEKAGLVFSVADSVTARFAFSHELIRQAVLSTLSAARRRRLHLEVGNAIERTNAAALEDCCGDLAHHYRLSGTFSKAIAYLIQAVRQAIQRSASTEAIEQVTTALRILDSFPDNPQRDQQELLLQTMIGPVLIATKGNAADEVGLAYRRAVELGRRVSDDAQLFPVLFGLRSFHLVRAELREARELGEQLLILSETKRDDDLYLEAKLAQGNTAFLFGNLIDALESLEQAYALYDSQKGQSHAFLYGLDPGVFCLAKIAWIHALLGQWDKSSQTLSEALALAQRQSHAYSLAVAIAIACPVLSLQGNWAALQQQAEVGITLCTEQGFQNILQQSKQHRGYALVQQGQTEEGIMLMREGLADSRATGAALYLPYYLAMLVKACEIMGRIEEGLALLTEAIALVEKTQESVYEATLYQLKGDLIRGQFSAQRLHPHIQQQAEACLQRSIEIARRQKAKSFELSALLSLSRLWHQQEQRAKAQHVLAEIYARFGKSFESADLRAAQLLLEDLSRDI